MTCREALDILERERHSHDWIFFRELRIGAGYTGDSQQRVDAFAVHCFPSKNHHRFAYEIKTSRADFLRELASPRKRRPALMMSNYFYFVTPPGIVKPDEVPIDCGLLEITKAGRETVRQGFHMGRVLYASHIGTVVEAPFREGRPPTWGMIVAMARNKRAKVGASAWDAVQELEVVSNG